MSMSGFELALAGAGVVFFGLMLAIVSAAEQTFLSLTETQIRRFGERGDGTSERILAWVRRPHQVIVTTILSSGVFGAGSILSLVAFLVGTNLVSLSGTLVPGLAGGLFLAVLGRAIPRAWASSQPERAAVRLVAIFSAVEMIFRPLVWMIRGLIGLISDEARQDFVAAEEFKAVAEDDETPRLLEDEKRELLHSIFEFGGTTAKEVMVPRIDMIMAEASTPHRDLLRLITEHGHSRIPIYEGSVDKILGAVHVKQLVAVPEIGQDSTPAREFARPVKFVPESKKIDELLREFQTEKTHIAIVVDEYGGTSGMVTFEDVLEEIVGEIEDEYDKAETLLEPLPDGSYRVAAKIDIDDLNDEINLQLPTENSDTLGGFIYELAGRVPAQGETVDYQDLRFIIDRVHRQRILRVRITKREPQPA
jgi:putative hemolysin